MSDFSAVIPVADMDAANSALNEAGFGPNNFSVPAFDSPSPQFATMHSWNNPAFLEAVRAIPTVTVKVNGEGVNPLAAAPAMVDAIELTSQVCEIVGSQWAGAAKPLEGVVTPGLYYDAKGVYWWVIQGYDTAVYPDPIAIPALIRTAKVPWSVLPWTQPLDQYDAYKLVNSFTGKPDQCTHAGQTWYVSGADAAGNNVWEPGVFGWTVMGAAADASLPARKPKRAPKKKR